MLTITVIGAHDDELVTLLAATGAQVTDKDALHLAALAQADAPQPDALVLDLRDGGDIPAAIADVRRQHPTTGILIVAQALDPALLVDAMRAGVNEIITPPVTTSSLEHGIARLAGQRPAAAAGKVFGFVGAKGGVGTTTVAVSVAAALGAISAPSRTLIADLHRSGGDAALFLGAEPRFSNADALQNTNRLDDAFLRGIVTQAAPGLDLLASPERAAGAHVDPAQIRSFIDLVSRAYRYTIVDLPRSDEAVLDGLDGLAAIVIVANQELAAVRGAGHMASRLRQRYGPSRVMVVVGRSDSHADLTQKDVERVAGIQFAETFPNDYRLATHALHTGRPLALEKHALAGVLTRFALALAGVQTGARRAAKPSSLFGLFAAGRS
jgi:pilus assembly protein CpaE